MLPETQFLVRVFPSPNKDWSNVKLDSDQKLVYLRSLADLKRGKSGNNIYWQFKVDQVFVNTSQEELYHAIVTKDLLQKVFKGNDLIIFCFGSSSTGKSYSAFGIYNRFEYRGIAPRLLEDIFKLKDENSSLYKTDISLAYVEIIGKNIHNLLLKGKPVILKTDRKAYHVLGTRLETICNGIKLMFDGDDRRNFEHEASHCGTTILTFDITSASLLPTNPTNTVGRIHLIDTAGTDYGTNPSKSFKCHIDANLTKCELNTLCSWYGDNDASKKTFLQRGSTLALYLGTSITNSYSRLLGHIRTSNEDIANSMSTLLFGTRLRKLHSPLLVQAKIKNTGLIVKGLQDELREIKNNIVADKLINSVFMPGTISQDHMEYVLREIQTYCQSGAYQPSVLLAKAHPLILILGFREIYNRDTKGLKAFYEKQLEARDKAEQEKIKPLSASSVQKKTSPSKHSSTGAVLQPPVQETKTSGDENLSKRDIESATTAEESYARTFSEYLSKTGPIKLKIKLYESEIEECLKTKSELQSKLTDLKYKIESLRLELKNEEWNTFHKKLERDMFTQGGRELVKSPEQENLESHINAHVNEFNQTRSTLFNVHNKYMAAGYALNEVMINAEKEFNEYVKLMSNNTLLLPRQESLVCDTVPLPQAETKEETIDRVKEAEKCFSKYQRKPLKRY